jgi:hypothetical protein
VVVLALSVALAIIGVMASDLDVPSAGGSNAVTVEKARPAFHLPADRLRITTGEASNSQEREFHMPSDRVLVGVGVTGESADPERSNRPTDRP